MDDSTKSTKSPNVVSRFIKRYCEVRIFFFLQNVSNILVYIMAALISLFSIKLKRCLAFQVPLSICGKISYR